MFKQSRKFTVTIPQPCSESWHEMTPVEKGRFCGQCSKTVVDYTQLSDKQLIEAMKSSGSTCGHFLASQLNRELAVDMVKRTRFFPMAMFTSLLAVISPEVKGSQSVTKIYLSDVSAGVKLPEKDTADITISGIVAVNGQPIQGARALIKGFNNQVKTDSLGHFILTVPSTCLDSVVRLCVSSIGYMTVETNVAIVREHLRQPIQVDMSLMISGEWVGGDRLQKYSRWKRFKRKVKSVFRYH